MFQIFVANPHKPNAVLDILVRNKDKLADFLSRFTLADEADSNLAEQFNDEKAYVVKQIRELKMNPLGAQGMNQGPPLPPPNPICAPKD